MDPEAFLDVANQVVKLKMFPYFDIAHCALCALSVREDLGSGAQAFSRKHPLACWLSYMLVVFAGGMVANGLLAEPILGPLKNTPQLLVATLVWYLVFYTPMDLGYKLTKFLPVKIIFSAMKEIYRCKKVYDGVTHAAKLYPNAYLIMIIIGTLKGNGAGFTRLIERLIRGVWTPTAMEFMQPSFYTKASLVASLIFILDKKTELISPPPRPGLLRHRDFLRLLQTVVHHPRHPRPFHTFREFNVRPFLRRHLGQSRQDIRQRAIEGGGKQGREENQLIDTTMRQLDLMTVRIIKSNLPD